MRKLYNSLTRLLIQLEEDGMESWNDDENSFYLFGCTKQGIDATFKIGNRENKLDKEKILSVLESAEKQGRVRWRTENEDNDAEWFSKALNIPMDIVNKMRDTWGAFNLPRMEDVIEEYSELNIQIVERLAIQKLKSKKTE